MKVKQRAFELSSAAILLVLLVYMSVFNPVPVLVLAVALIAILVLLSFVMPLLITQTYSTFKLPYPPLRLLSLIFLIYVGTASLFGLAYYLLNETSSHEAFCIRPPEGSLNNVGCAPLSIERSIYFSFVTLATVGYGDITPKTGIARLAVISEIVIGLFLISVLLAVVVSKSVEVNSRAQPGNGGTPAPAAEQANASDRQHE